MVERTASTKKMVAPAFLARSTIGLMLTFAAARICAGEAVLEISLKMPRCTNLGTFCARALPRSRAYWSSLVRTATRFHPKSRNNTAITSTTSLLFVHVRRKYGNVSADSSSELQESYAMYGSRRGLETFVATPIEFPE